MGGILDSYSKTIKNLIALNYQSLKTLNILFLIKSPGSILKLFVTIIELYSCFEIREKLDIILILISKTTKKV